MACGNINVKQINYYELTNGIKIKGSLGYNLGEIITIHGVCIKDETAKANLERILLKVEKINNKTLLKPIIISYKIPAFIKTKKPCSKKHFNYTGYESGAFSGIPQRAFNYIPFVTTTDFQFNTFFVILK